MICFRAEFIQPICLLSKSEMNSINIAKVMPYVAGWGSVNPFQQDGKNSHCTVINFDFKYTYTFKRISYFLRLFSLVQNTYSNVGIFVF